jgi:hypothetical protein
VEKAIEALLGPSAPKDIEKSFVWQIIRHREMIESRRAKYARPLRWPLIRNADCINSFLLDVMTGQRACFCIGKKCPRRDIKN